MAKMDQFPVWEINKGVLICVSFVFSTVNATVTVSQEKSFYAILKSQARTRANATAYRFEGKAEDDGVAITYQELLSRVNSVVHFLRDRLGVGDRALISMPSCPEFIVAFLACQALGVISVPVPVFGRNKDSLVVGR